MTAPRFHLSPRRKVLLATVLLVLVAMLVLRLMGIAGFNGTQPREMDWDDDGTASRAEIVQGYTVVAVDETRDGPRTCRRYVRLRDREAPFRVECRVVFDDGEAPAAPARADP
ncbi:EF-hand domain-containing protein [Luteimonas kalidii]|uniref:EF-hand domain-containing protein n=1 Tax=Luteimonas kalidii TaxID=3042025 RepID=A0ABT6JUJ5_9GAMM|nr:EF-hand domain-containing protein [Luteimonas kalidii]MDH5834369.1 EF-hand domain-containing protein [Luteimonas kalidii]